MIITDNYYPPNAFRICADKIEEDVEGRVFCPLCKEDIHFSGMGELLVKMDELFDAVGYPQAYQDKRSFDRGKGRANAYRGIPQGIRKPEKIISQAGDCITLDIVVTSRRNASWQGEIYDVESRFLGGFSGEIELLENIIKAANI